MDFMVRTENVIKTYNRFNAVNGISLSLKSGHQYAIQGASGSGKSTLLYLIGGLEVPSKGEVWVNGENIALMTDARLAECRNRLIGFIFQFHFLLPSINCLNNIYLPAQIGNALDSSVEKRVSELAEILGVGHCLSKYPYQLSGGEQQRINIIRALSLKPKLLLCDEPTGNLDSDNSSKVIDLLQGLAGSFGATLVVVTHDDLIASRFTEVFVLKDGHLVTG